MKIKNKLIAFVIFAFLFVGCSKSDSEQELQDLTCRVDGCNSKCTKIMSGYIYADYCKVHLCEEEDCMLCKNNEGKYCSFHSLQIITLSETQEKEIKKLVDDYCNTLMKKHSGILSINIFNESPIITPTKIYYDCNVVRSDSDTNLAKIYLHITEDGIFEIDGLEYDE